MSPFPESTIILLPPTPRGGFFPPFSEDPRLESDLGVVSELTTAGGGATSRLPGSGLLGWSAELSADGAFSSFTADFS